MAFRWDLALAGKVTANTVIDNIWGQDTSSDTGDAASGILIFASPGISVTNNYVGSAQFGIALVTDGGGFCGTSQSPVSCGTSDNTTVTGNKVFGTQIFDGIDACSNTNTITTNTLHGNTESGIHLDDSCANAALGTSSGSGNTATGNTINNSCAGVLLGTNSNTATPNTVYNVANTTLPGAVCPVSGAGVKTATKHGVLRPSPYRVARK